MKLTKVKIVAILSVLAISFAVLPGLSSTAKADFSFQSLDGKNLMSYRCDLLDDPVETDANSNAAHTFFEAAILEITHQTARSMNASMSPTRQSSQIIPVLEEINANMDRLLKDANQEMERRFGCSYRGSS